MRRTTSVLRHSPVEAALVRLDRLDEAIQTCRQGLEVCPDDAELLFFEGLFLTRKGDFLAAKEPFLRLLNTKGGQQIGSVLDGMRGHRGRHQLALVCVHLNQFNEAEDHWQEALREAPNYVEGLFGLGNLYLSQQRLLDLQGVLARLEQIPGAALSAVLLTVRGHQAQKEFAQAKRLLADARAKWPDSLALLEHQSVLLFVEDKDHNAAEQVLLEFLRRAPKDSAAAQRLQSLRLRRFAAQDQLFIDPGTFGQF